MRTAGKTDKNQRMESEGIGKPREKFKREKMINGQTALGGRLMLCLSAETRPGNCLLDLEARWSQVIQQELYC